MPLKHRVAVSLETLQRLKELAKQLNLDSPHQVIKVLLSTYERGGQKTIATMPICPYCEATTFQSTKQLRKHIANRHIYDIVEDIKKYGRG